MPLGGVGGRESAGPMRSGDGLPRMVRRLPLDSCGDSASRGLGPWLMVQAGSWALALNLGWTQGRRGGRLAIVIPLCMMATATHYSPGHRVGDVSWDLRLGPLIKFVHRK